MKQRPGIQEVRDNFVSPPMNIPMQTTIIPSQQMSSRGYLGRNPIRHQAPGQMISQSQQHPHHHNHHHHQHHTQPQVQQPQQQQQQQQVHQLQQGQQGIRAAMTQHPNQYNQMINIPYAPFQLAYGYSPYPSVPRVQTPVQYQPQYVYNVARPMQPNVHNQNSPYVPNAEYSAPQINDQIPANYGPSKPPIQQQPPKERKIATIQDPNTLEYYSVQDLLTKPSFQSASPKPAKVTEEKERLSPSTSATAAASASSSSSDTALEFQNKISQLAFEKDLSTAKVNDTNVANKNNVEKDNVVAQPKAVNDKKENDQVEIDAKKVVPEVSSETNINEVNKKDVLKEAIVEGKKSEVKQSTVVNESKQASSTNEKKDASRTPSPVISTSPSSISTPSPAATVVSDKDESSKEINLPVLNQPNGDIEGETDSEKIETVKECKEIIDEVKLSKEDKDKDINNYIKENVEISKEIDKQVKNESIDVKKSLPPSSPLKSSIASKDGVDNMVIKSEIVVKPVVDLKSVNESKIQSSLIKTDEIVEKENVDSTTTTTAKENVKQTPQSTVTSTASKADDKPAERKNSGKFEYESSFLRKLQNVPASLVKPKTLPPLEIIHDAPICSRPSIESRQQNSTDMFFPTFLPMPNQNRNQPRNISMRSSQGGRSNSQQDRPRKIISPSLTQDVKLHTTENAWKPKAEEKNLNDDELSTEKLAKAFRGILNKLTPEKYEKLLVQVKNLQIDNVKRLELILKLIFEKAVDEPAFCRQYANLCKHLCETLKVIEKDEEEKEKTVHFSHLLVTKCQQEFEGKMYEGIDVEGRRKDISQITEEDKKKALFDELDDEMRRARKRSLGNIKLIGELYKLGTIKCFVVIICVKKLLSDGEEAEESLECLCTLLRTIGQQLEKDFAVAVEQKKTRADALSQYFTLLEAMANNDKISSRVRFMIRDIIDLRNDGWKERKVQKENKPKTITELRQEAQEEETKMLRLQQQQALQQMQQPTSHSFQKRQDSMKKDYGVASRKSQSGTQTIQAFKQIGKSNNPTEPTLGPSSMGSWGKGAGGGGSQQKPASTTSMPANRFLVLSDTNKQGRSSQSKDISKPSNKEGLMKKPDGHPSGPPPFGSARPTSSRASSSKENTSVPNSRTASITKESPNDDSMKKSLSEEEVMRISINLVKEYISNKNIEEVGEDLKASLANDQFINFVTTAINHALEVSSQTEQNDVGMLFEHLLKRKTLALDYLRKGVEPLLEMADDIVVDVPKFWDYTAIIFAPVFLSIQDDDRKTFFVDALKIAKGANRGAKFMSLLVKRASELTSPENVTESWSRAELKWSDFLDDNDDEKAFINNNNLSFLESLSNSSLVNSKLFHEIEKQVELQVSEEKLIDFIQEKFPKDVQATPEFVSALFKSVVKGCLNKAEDNRTTIYSLDDKKLKSKCALLGKFCNNEDKKELGAIFALQELAEDLQHPSKMLNQVFASLHDQNVISQDAFLEWERSDQLAPGKAMAVLNVKQFLTWLKEEDSDG